MAITETITQDCHVGEDGVVHAREITRIFKDDVEMSKKYWRTVIDVGEPVPTKFGTGIVSETVEKIHTPARKAARDIVRAEDARKNPPGPGRRPNGPPTSPPGRGSPPGGGSPP